MARCRKRRSRNWLETCEHLRNRKPNSGTRAAPNFESFSRYGGTFPGPTIRVRSGRPLQITFQNHLNKSTFYAIGQKSATVHLHGGHSPAKMDGQPNSNLIAPGASYTYVYPLREDGTPERAAFQWYHDHLMDRTARNVWRGLAGMFILDDAFDSALPLPKGKFDVPLMLVDRSFDEENQLTDPYYGDQGSCGVPDDAVSGIEGDVVLVNGASKPHFDVEPRKYRLRFLNAANFRTYDLSVAYSELIAPLTKLPMIQIANESGLLPTSGLRTHTVLGPAERAEFVVDFSGLDGQRMYLEGSWCNKPESSGEEELPPCSRGETSRKLMEFRVSEGPVANSAPVPAQLRSVSAFQVPAEVDKEWVFGFGSHPWGINGEGFDPSNVAP